MKRTATLLLTFIFVFTTALFAQNAKPKPKSDAPLTVSEILERSLKGMESEIVPAAEAMPDDKYSFAPASGEFTGVRNFGAQVRHLGGTNYLLAAALLGEKSPADTGKDGDGPDNLKTKSEMVAYLKDSFAYLHKAIATGNEKNLTEEVQNPFGEGKRPRLRVTLIALGHPWDHYGQMVEYLRMNGIIPPASRPPQK